MYLRKGRTCRLAAAIVQCSLLCSFSISFFFSCPVSRHFFLLIHIWCFRLIQPFSSLEPHFVYSSLPTGIYRYVIHPALFGDAKKSKPCSSPPALGCLSDLLVFSLEHEWPYHSVLLGLCHTLCIEICASLSLSEAPSPKLHRIVLYSQDLLCCLNSTLMWLADRLSRAVMHIRNMKAL